MGSLLGSREVGVHSLSVVVVVVVVVVVIVWKQTGLPSQNVLLMILTKFSYMSHLV